MKGKGRAQEEDMLKIPPVALVCTNNTRPIQKSLLNYCALGIVSSVYNTANLNSQHYSTRGTKS